MTKLNEEQIAFWNDHSYLTLPGLFANLASDLSHWINEVERWSHGNADWLSFFEMDEPDQLSRVENFVPHHRGLAQVLNGDRMLAVVSALMNEQAVLYKDRINFKLPGGGAHAAHQDGVAYDQGGNASFDPEIPSYLSVLICVDRTTDANGCFEVASNWCMDRLDILPMESPFPDKPNFSKISQAVEDELDWKKIHCDPGDVIVFTERLPHRSQANQSDKKRRILYGVYNPLSLGDKRSQYFREKRQAPNDPRYMVGNPHAPVE